MRRAINIDDLPADTPVDHYGFPIAAQPVEALPGSSLAEMTNDYQWVKGHFYCRAPKLKQQKQLVLLQAKVQGIAEPLAIIDTYCALVGLFLFVEEHEDYRLALPDEIDDNFDLAEIVEIVSKMTGLKLAGEGETKN